MMSSEGTAAWFHTTSWGLVVGARHDAGDLECLLRAYWSPVYAYVRAKGYGPHDAADLTQEFLSEIVLGRNLISKADPSRGRFRAFLKSALRNFLVDQHRKETTARAAPKDGHFVGDGAGLASHEPSASDASGSAFDRQWAAAVLALTIERVEAACAQEGLRDHWKAFSIAVLGPVRGRVRPVSMDDLAQRVGADSPARVSNMVQTIKRRFRRTLRQVIAETVESPEDVERELGELGSAFA